MPLTRREEAEAIEKFGDDLLKLCRDFCVGFDNRTVDRVCAVPNQEHLETIGKAFQALGRTIQDECDDACPICEDTGRATWLDDCEECGGPA